MQVVPTQEVKAGQATADDSRGCEAEHQNVSLRLDSLFLFLSETCKSIWRSYRFPKKKNKEEEEKEASVRVQRLRLPSCLSNLICVVEFLSWALFDRMCTEDLRCLSCLVPAMSWTSPECCRTLKFYSFRKHLPRKRFCFFFGFFFYVFPINVPTDETQILRLRQVFVLCFTFSLKQASSH